MRNQPQRLEPPCELEENPFECVVASDVIARNIPWRIIKFQLPAQVEVLLEEPDRIIAGYANIEVVDTQGELIPAEAWGPAFSKFMANPKFRLVHVFHTDIPVGEVIFEYKDKKDRIWKSHVDDKGLFVVVRVRKDLVAADRVWNAIEKGELRAFSISGLALERRVECSGGRCYRVIPRLELHSITICEKGANIGAIFDVVKSILPISLKRSRSKSVRWKMSEDEQALLEQELSPETPTGPEPGTDSKSTSQKEETQKQGSTSNPTDVSPLLMELKASIDKLAGKVEAIENELKARKPEKYPPPGKKEEEEGGEEPPSAEAAKAGKYPYPERYPYPGKYPRPGKAKAKKPDEEEEEEEEEKAGKKPEEEEEEEKARRKPPLPFAPPQRKGEVLAISEEDLTKMIEAKATEIAEAKTKELIDKALGKTDKRGEVPSIGGPDKKETGLDAILKTPLAKIGTMKAPDFVKLTRGGS